MASCKRKLWEHATIICNRPIATRKKYLCLIASPRIFVLCCFVISNAVFLIMPSLIVCRNLFWQEYWKPIVATWGEVTYPSLKDNMGVVSQVFAGVALELIDHNSDLEPEDADNMVLPVGAKTMSSTIEELSKFIAAVRYLFVLFIDKNIDHPAIEMVRRAFYKYEAQM